MNTKACLLVAVLLAGCVRATAVTYYASPNGAGDGRTPQSPFKIADFWPKAGPGDTLLLLDGTYTGEDSMLVPPEGMAGEPDRPITVKALNDGSVLIDGENQRRPVHLSRNAWFVLEGFNACRGGRPSHLSGSAIAISGRRRGEGSSHIVVRRVVAWDAKDNGNSGVWALNYSDHILLEDVAGFGVGRKTFCPFSCRHTTIRRAWGRWEGYHEIGPKMTFSLLYHSYHTLLENCVGTWSAEQLKEDYPLCVRLKSHPRKDKPMRNYAVDQPYGVFASDRLDPSDPGWFTHSKILGCIGYVRGTDRYQAPRVFGMPREGDIEFRDNVAYIEPGTHTRVAPLAFSHPRNAEVTGRRVHGFTAVGGAELGARYGVELEDVEHGRSVSEVSSIFTSPHGAQVARRYVDGQLTDEPLWPWPMDQRIKEALALAGRRSVTHGMPRDDGLLTSAIEQMFGPIPAAQRLGSNQ
ncbi:MAG: hypothetical protein JXR37_14755 [Kiritimatiellae bacterium]|nr:hypothetical protein [Kiritimatiellia bacterium]